MPPMPKYNNPKIAGGKTARDWCAFRDEFNLPENPCPEIWARAFDEYLYPRLKTRYLHPIEAIKKIDKAEGEGFSMMAILCTLVEFLESTIQGRKYVKRKGQEREDDLALRNEYSWSGGIFKSLLTNRHPFCNHFDQASATSFYDEIRCGLLHEARTKNGWKILAASKDQSIIDSANQIIYRNDFQEALEEFIAWYRNELQTNQQFQEAFVRKFDHLCE